MVVLKGTPHPDTLVRSQQPVYRGRTEPAQLLSCLRCYPELTLPPEYFCELGQEGLKPLATESVR